MLRIERALVRLESGCLLTSALAVPVMDVQGDYNLGDGLPDLLARHVTGIIAMRGSGDDKTGLLQRLYADIICDALARAPLFIVLDDTQRLGEEDRATLYGIARGLKGQRPTESETVYKSVLLCTTTRPLTLEGCDDEAPRALHDVDGVVNVPLRELDETDVVEIAKLTLGCQELDRFIAATITSTRPLPAAASRA